MVKTYDEAARPDILLLPDLSQADAKEKDALNLLDAVCDATASAARELMLHNEQVRLIIDGNEFSSDLGLMREALACARVREGSAFEEAAAETLRRMGRTGEAVFILTRLTLRDADLLIRLKNAAAMRVVLIWVTDLRLRETRRLREKLEAGGVEVAIYNPEENI